MCAVINNLSGGISIRKLSMHLNDVEEEEKFN